jgi:hypothetical protein
MGRSAIDHPKERRRSALAHRLEMSALFDIASQIAPRKMSDILGLMAPEAAERLTVEMARHAGSDRSAAELSAPRMQRDGTLRCTEGSAPHPVASPSRQGSNQPGTLLISG